MCLLHNSRFGPPWHPQTEEESALTEKARAVMKEIHDTWKPEKTRGLIPDRSPLAAGWQCPNCGKAHSPDIATCPEPAKGGSLAQRLKEARQ